MASQAAQNQRSVFDEQLLLSIAEDLKLPLQQIGRRAELLAMTPEPVSQQELSDIQITAHTALRLLDAYLFGARLVREPDYSLAMEPVSVSSVLYDAGQQLDQLAKLYGVELELNVAGKFGPVVANRQGLQSALVSLGYSLIESLPNLSDGQAQKPRLQLAAHRCRYGIVAGLYSEAEQITVEALRRGRKLQGRVRQPLVTLSHSGAAGVFVADVLFAAMNTELKPSQYRAWHGLAAVLRPNPQLQLV